MLCASRNAKSHKSKAMAKHEPRYCHHTRKWRGLVYSKIWTRFDFSAFLFEIFIGNNHNNNRPNQKICRASLQTHADNDLNIFEWALPIAAVQLQCSNERQKKRYGITTTRHYWICVSFFVLFVSLWLNQTATAKGPTD